MWAVVIPALYWLGLKDIDALISFSYLNYGYSFAVGQAEYVDVKKTDGDIAGLFMGTAKFAWFVLILNLPVVVAYLILT